MNTPTTRRGSTTVRLADPSEAVDRVTARSGDVAAGRRVDRGAEGEQPDDRSPDGEADQGAEDSGDDAAEGEAVAAGPALRGADLLPGPEADDDRGYAEQRPEAAD